MDKPKAIQDAWDDCGYAVRSIARNLIHSQGWEYEIEAKSQPDGSVRFVFVVPENDDMARQRRYAEESEARIKAWKEEVI